MAEKRHLENAPIVEAVVELRFPGSIDWPEAPPGEYFGDDYSEIRPVNTLSIAFNPGSQGVQRDDREAGWELINPAENKLIRLFEERIIISKRAPYTDWQDLIAGLYLALPLLEALQVKQKASRLGTRFINRIPVKRGSVELSEYLINGPSLPKIADSVTEFSLRTVHVDHSSNCFVKRTISSDSNQETGPAILLDIDAFSREELEVTSELLDKKLTQLRKLKNDAFFDSVTDSALEGM